ncbi:long-chain acyl-CoA synthetase [Humitalea rosea]|uniref:Long-chain acyl-CoA synthetase n=1 Tax=Humitalea rosea TaxID=990373 RepID=A0A2W7IN65_9PROT|nr:long-chain fatty acid--CoA ligase [Humitalea rosea]PZW48756.1 long-chain acyl-CoA synthetase [Humitalea rosea]
MAENEWNSLPSMLFDCARRWPDRPMLRVWRGGGWQTTSWGDFALSVARIAAWLRAEGVSPGDRVLLVAENRPEFPIADTAIMAIGAVTVPTYVTNTVADHAHILRDSGARAAIVATARLAGAIDQAAEAGLDLRLCMETAEGWHGWAEADATPADAAMLMAEAEAIPPGRLACLVYTSGTGGLPKGVMQPHRALLANRAGVAEVARRLGLDGTCYLSFLPLSHSYEHTVGCFLLPSLGIEVVYSRGAERLAAELADIRPSIVTAVPRLFEVLRARILGQMEKAGPMARWLFDRALAQGLRRMDGPPLNPLERLLDLVLDRLVRRKIQARFGGRLVAMVSGGARLDPDLSGFFLALGVPVLQGYGQTEAGPVISVNLPWDNHRRTVGPPLSGVEARIAADGELLVRGPLVMDGYWNDPEATASAIQDGWLHTGDVGVLENGRLVITDRKRDFIKTLGGDMISPAKIESLLMAEPEILQAVIAGEGRPNLVALVVPAEGADAEAALKRINARVSPVERIRRFAVVPAFTLENGLLTPTMKVKRRAVLEAHEGGIAALY